MILINFTEVEKRMVEKKDTRSKLYTANTFEKFFTGDEAEKWS